MGRGGGGGGSSRSSGGGSRGGSRSSGGHRGGGGFSSSSHRGGFGGGHSSSSFHSRPSGGGYYPPPPRPPRPPRGGYYYGGGGYYPPPPPPRRKSLSEIVISWIATIIIIVVCFSLVTGVFSSGGGGGSSITKSTVAREKLDAQYVTTTEWYTDTAGWVSNPIKLTSGMREFYNKTGVQPYLYITETIDGVAHPSDSQMEMFADKLYEELFDDEGHLLVVFQEYDSDSEYFCWTVAGKMAKTVFDNEARQIFFDYIDHYYYSDLDEDGFFSTAFSKTAERMMTVTKSPMPKIIISVIILAIVIIAFVWWKKAKQQRNIEDENTERILKAATSSTKFEDTELSDLEEKYSDDSD